MRSVVSQVIGGAKPQAIGMPVFAGRRGHPTIFPWSLATHVPDIPVGCGLNWLVHNGGVPVQEIPVDDDSIHFDLDTPEDYARLLTRLRPA